MSSHQFDRAKWQSMTIFEQMGNIGSEVGRAFSAKRRGDDESMTAALYRGLDLIDATAEKLVADGAKYRLREVLRAREQFAELSDETLETYFMHFALAARNGR